MAVHIVSGFLPIEAQFDKKVLSLFNNVTLQYDSSTEKQLAKRQLPMKNDNSSSWFIHVKKVRKGAKDQESIQSSTTPDPGYHMGK